MVTQTNNGRDVKITDLLGISKQASVSTLMDPDGPTMALLCPYWNNLEGRTERRFNKK